MDATIGRVRVRGRMVTLRRFLAASRLNMVAVALVTIIVFVGIFGPWLSPHEPNSIDLLQRLLPPS